MGDHQTSKYDHEHWPPVALQPRALRFGQDDLRLGLQLRALGLDELPLDLELPLVGLVLVLDHVIDDVQYLAAYGSDQVPDHANLRCYEWCSDASGYFGPIRTQLLLRGLRPLRSPSDRRADREIRAGIRNPET